MSQRISFKKLRECTIAQFEDKKILAEPQISELKVSLYECADGDCQLLVINFSNVTYMSAAMLTTIITLQKKMHEKRGKLALCCINPVVFMLFTITHLHKHFTICREEQQAVEYVHS